MSTIQNTEAIEYIMLKIERLENNISLVRDPPEVFYCAHRTSEITYTKSVIDFQDLFYARSNQPTGGFDLSTGEFTAPYPGTYIVTWSLQTYISAGEHWVWIYLSKNGENIVETLHWST